MPGACGRCMRWPELAHQACVAGSPGRLPPPTGSAQEGVQVAQGARAHGAADAHACSRQGRADGRTAVGEGRSRHASAALFIASLLGPTLQSTPAHPPSRTVSPAPSISFCPRTATWMGRTSAAAAPPPDMAAAAASFSTSRPAATAGGASCARNTSAAASRGAAAVGRRSARLCAHRGAAAAVCRWDRGGSASAASAHTEAGGK